MKKIRYNILLLTFLCNNIYGDDYKVYFLGIPVVNVTMNSIPGNSLSFYTETSGLFKSIWPLSNEYYVEFDSLSYGIRTYNKTINQGKYHKKLNCYYDIDKLQLNYNNSYISANDSTQNIFTLLARIMEQEKKNLDAKWFPMNHEGIDYRARYLWIDDESISNNNQNILCDHYKLDIELVDNEMVKLSPSDYFTDNIVSDEAVRQIWVEKSLDNRLIKASVSIYGLLVTAEIQ